VAIRCIGTASATARSMARALDGVPTPMVSPREISSQPISASATDTRTTSVSDTSPW